MHILVTGGNGFVGKALCKEAASRGHAVSRALRAATVAAEDREVGDIDGWTDWGAALRGIDAVIHLAARVHVMRDKVTDPLAEFRKVNVAGTENLARQAAAAGVKRLVYVSSIKVNGESTAADQVFAEDDVPRPHDPYAISKWEAEQVLQRIAINTGLEVVIVRPPLVYGPGCKGNFASMLNWVRKGIPFPLGAVHNRRSVLALDNLVDFLILCADREKSPSAANELFLISDGEDVSTSEMLRKVARAYGKAVHLIPVPVALLRFGASLLGKRALADRLLGSLAIDITKARDLLGWRPLVTMDGQLREMARDAANF